jgi:lipopolysaccharide export system permease protein
MKRILFRYLLLEQAVPFFVSLLVLTLVLFLGKIMRYTQMLFASESSLADLGMLLLYSLPYFLVFTIPMATLLAVLLAFARLANDNEITAMKTAGISFYQTLPPVALVTGFAWLTTLGLSSFVLPHSNRGFQRVLLETARSRGQLALKERVFNDQFDGLVFFINTISPDGRHLGEVFIADERSPETKSTIVAEEGFVVHDPSGKRITLRLLRGQILRVGDAMESLQTIRFQNYDFNLDLDSFAFNEKDFRKRERHLSFTELRQALTSTKLDSKKRNSLSFEWHRRLSLPFACIVLGLIAAPLSVQSRTGSRLSGVVLGLVLFLLYYFFVSAAKALGKDGPYPPAIGLWLPNIIFGILAVILWIKTARESPFKPILFVQRSAELLASWVKTRLKS